MAFRTRRQHRYILLRESGFLPFEARPLSKVPIRSVPYMKQLVLERRKMLSKAQGGKLTVREWEDKVADLYIEGGWLKKDDKAGKLKWDPWQMLRDAEDRFKQKAPQYQSPWKKRYQSWRDFASKIDRTMKKQQAEKGI